MKKIFKVVLIFFVTSIINLNYLVSQTTKDVCFPSSNNVISDCWRFYANSSAEYYEGRMSLETVGSKINPASGDFPQHLSTRVYNGRNWSLTPNKLIDVKGQQGKTYVFRAIIAGRFLGNFSNHPNAGLQLQIMKYSSSTTTDESGPHSALITGNFAWKEVSVEFTVDNTTEYIKPRFVGWYGGGELFLYQASCTLKEEPSTLHNPSFYTNVPETSIPFIQGVNANGFNVNDVSQWTLYCRSKEGVVNTAYDLTNNLYRPIIAKFPNSGSKSYFTTGVYNNSEWSLDAGKYNIPANNNSSYIFSAVIAGRKVGESNGTGDGMWLQIIPFTSAGPDYSKAVYSENIKGTFSWKQVNVKINNADLPPNTISLQPRFYSTSGGGEIYISSASFYPFEKSPQLTIPPSSDLPEPLYESITGVKANGFAQDDVDKWTLFCRSNEGVVNTAYDAANNLYRPFIKSFPNLTSRNYLTTAVYNNSDWALEAGKFKVPSNTKLDYTFSAVVAGRSLGEVSSEGNGMLLQIIPYTSSGPVYSKAVFSEYIKGTFSWKQVNVKINNADLPENTLYLLPRFYTPFGGGELFVASAAFTPYDNAPKLAIPPSNVLPDTYYNLLPKLNAGFCLSPDISQPWNLYSDQRNNRPKTVSGEYVDAALNIKTDKVSHLQTSVFNEGSWVLSPTTKIPVGDNMKTFIFTAIIAGNHIGQVTDATDGGARLEILEYSSSVGDPITWSPTIGSETFSGTFGWRQLSVKVTVGATTKFIQPRFFCRKGGGELYVYKAILQPVTSSIQLEKPTDAGMPVSRKNVSAIYTPSVGTLSNGWLYWEKNKLGEANFYNGSNVANINTSFIRVDRIHNDLEKYKLSESNVYWSLEPNFYYEVTPGKAYTFTAVVNVEKWGTTKVDGQWGPHVNFMCFDENKALNLELTDKTSGDRIETENSWRKISKTIIVPASIKYIRPRFVGYSKARFYISNAILLEDGVKERLIIPADGVSIQTINADRSNNNHGLYTTGLNQKIRWNISPSTFSGNLDYVVSGPKGEVFESSSITLSNTTGATIVFPTTLETLEPGYYELKIFGNLSRSGVNGSFPIQAFSSAAAFPNNPNFAFGNGHFGIFGIPGNADGLYRILNMTWERPLTYNIITGSQNVLPQVGELPAYQLAWENKRKNTQDILRQARYINTVEIWNEPTGEGAVFPKPISEENPENNLLCNMDYQPFVNMLQAAKSGIKSADVSTKIILNLEWPNWYTDFPNGLNNITSQYGNKEKACDLYDVMAPHPYLMGLYKGSATGPEIKATKVYKKNEWNETVSENLTDEYDIENLMYRLDKYEVASRHCSKPKEMWSTEYGWPTSVVGEVDQARFIVRSALLQFCYGFKKVMAFRYNDRTWEKPLELSFGLSKVISWEDRFIPKPSLFAYSFLSHTIGNLPYNGRFNLGKNIGCFVFGDNNNTGTNKRTVIALWNPEMNCNVSINLPTNRRIVDIFGKTYSSIPTIGEDPVYIIIEGSNPSDIDDLNVANIIVGKPTLPKDLFDIVR